MYFIMIGFNRAVVPTGQQNNLGFAVKTSEVLGWFHNMGISKDFGRLKQSFAITKAKNVFRLPFVYAQDMCSI